MLMMTAEEPLNAFVRALQDLDYFAKVGPSLALLQPGDWQGLLKWAELLDYKFSMQALYSLCRNNPQILAQMSKSPHLRGWNIESLKQAAGA